MAWHQEGRQAGMPAGDNSASLADVAELRRQLAEKTDEVRALLDAQREMTLRHADMSREFAHRNAQLSKALAASKMEYKLLMHEKTQSTATVQLLRAENEEMKQLWDADLRRLVKLKRRVKELETLLQAGKEGSAVPSDASSAATSTASLAAPSAASTAAPSTAPTPPRQLRKQMGRKKKAEATGPKEEQRGEEAPSRWHPILPPPNGDDVFALRADLPPFRLQQTVDDEGVIAELRASVFNRPSIRERFMAGEIPKTMFEFETPREPERSSLAMGPPAIRTSYGHTGPAIAAPVSPQSLDITEGSRMGLRDEAAHGAPAVADKPEVLAKVSTAGERRSYRNKGKQISYKELRTNAKQRQGD